MAYLNIKELKLAVNIEDVIGRYINLKKDGPHFKGQCIFHSGDNNASLVVTPRKRMFKCFGCGKGGDVLDFLMFCGRTLPEAIKEIKDPLNIKGTGPMPTPKAPAAPIVEWKQIAPPKGSKKPDISHYKHGKPSRTWAYKTDTGIIIGYVCRFDLKDGKEVLPFVYASDGKREEWRWKGFEKPRPLYNLDLIKANPDKTIVVVEGEKTADAVNQAMDTVIATTWIGGAKNMQHSDWSVLKGRKILLWPDNDKPGHEAMLEISNLLKVFAPSVLKWIKNPEWAPLKWDAADKEWKPVECRDLVRQCISELPIIYKEPALKAPEKKIEQKHAPESKQATPVKNSEAQEEKKPESKKPVDERHFRVLGYQKEGNVNLYHFFSYTSKSVISLSPSGMTKPNLLQLAPLRWWEKHFPAGKSSFSLEACQNWIINKAAEQRIFNSKWIRGRGAWMDEGKVVIHAGDRLIIDGKDIELQNFKSKYIYEIGEELGFTLGKPLDTREANKFLDLLKMLSWEREINAWLLAGWCVIAPVCGALSWRPHVWITGGVGTGKSWLLEKIVRPALGEVSLAVQGKTSEPGLRQTLKFDAIPVVFDEAEGEDKKAQDRMQDILSLVRIASSSDGGNVTMGGSGGTGAKTYKIRSCFLFASIAVQVAHQSDRTRVSVLGLKQPQKETKEDNWKKIQAKYREIMTPDFCERMRARTIQLLPVILKNAETFAQAAAAELGEQRAGDQIGALLAGAYSLSTSKIISYDNALKWIKQRDWSEERSHEETKDEMALVEYIMNYLVTVETANGRHERTIGELCMICAKLDMDRSGAGVDNICAEERLRRIGMKVDGNYIVIGNKIHFIEQLLTGTAWYRNYHKILMRLEGSVQMEKTTFASGMATRAVKIPMRLIFKG